MNTTRLRRTLATLACVAAAASLSACGGSTPSSSAPPASAQATPSDAAATPSTSTSPSAPTATVKPHPSGPPMLIDSIAPLSGTTVGVAMPISIVFSEPVKTRARGRIEKRLHLTTSTPVTGAWHWFGDRRVDFRPQHYWTPGTTIDLDAKLKYVGDGYGRYGTHAYTRHFRIGADVRTHVYADKHKTVVRKNGHVIRTMLSDAGSPSFPSWDGTMAVVNKEATTRMTSCSVQITCDPKNPDFYDIVLPWDVRITNSGTFLHYSTGDPYPGHSYGSHGCVHLSMADSKWFYELVKQGDPVTITGSPRGKAAGDNGYADYDVSWHDWLADSGMGAFTTATA